MRSPNAPTSLVFALTLCCLPLGNAAWAADIYKWVDEEGVVHFSDCEPPPECEAEVVEVAPPPSDEDVASARQRHDDLLDHQQARSAAREAMRSLTLRELGPLPENAVSTVFETVSTGIAADYVTRRSMFTMFVRPRVLLPDGAYVEAVFPNPSNVRKPLVVAHHWRDGDTEMMFLSPEFKGLRCQNYKVTVNAYSDPEKRDLIGTHRQLIQSRVHISGIRSAEDLMQAMEFGNCPTAP